MFTKYSKIVQLLLLLYVILYKCGSSPTTHLESDIKSPDEITIPNNVPNANKIIDLPENVNSIKSPVHQSDEIKPTWMPVSLFSAKDSDEKKDKKIIIDNMQHKATMKANINDDVQITHVMKVLREVINQSSDQINPSIVDNPVGLALILPDSENHNPNHEDPRAQDTPNNCSLPWYKALFSTECSATIFGILI